MSEELKPCPFCGAGETRIDETRQWSGMGYGEPISVSVIHWCAPVQGQPSRPITRIGRDRESAIAAWNRRTVSGQEATWSNIYDDLVRAGMDDIRARALAAKYAAPIPATEQEKP